MATAKRKSAPKTPPLPIPQPTDEFVAPASELIALPPEDILAELGVEPHEFDDFLKALSFVAVRAEGKTTAQAADVVGITRTLIYQAKWKRLIHLAQTLVMRKAVDSLDSVAAYVIEEWPRIVRTLVQTAKTANFDRDKVEAAKLVYQIFIQNAPKAPDASKEQQYLKELSAMQQNFNPQAPLILAQNVTVNTNPPAGGNVQTIDAEVVEDQSSKDAPMAE